jgi:hypothetical protein
MRVPISTRDISDGAAGDRRLVCVKLKILIRRAEVLILPPPARLRPQSRIIKA